MQWLFPEFGPCLDFTLSSYIIQYTLWQHLASPHYTQSPQLYILHEAITNPNYTKIHHLASFHYLLGNHFASPQYTHRHHLASSIWHQHSSCSSVVRASMYQPCDPASIPNMTCNESALTGGKSHWLLPSLTISDWHSRHIDTQAPLFIYSLYTHKLVSAKYAHISLHLFVINSFSP